MTRSQLFITVFVELSLVSISYFLSKAFDISPWIGTPVFFFSIRYFLFFGIRHLLGKIRKRITQDSKKKNDDDEIENEIRLSTATTFIEDYVEYQKGGNIPKQVTSRAVTALLRTNNKKEALYINRALGSFNVFVEEGIAQDIIDAAKNRKEGALARRLQKRLKWIANAKVPPNNEFINENPISLLTKRVAYEEISLEEALTKILQEEHIFLIRILQQEKT